MIEGLTLPIRKTSTWTTAVAPVAGWGNLQQPPDFEKAIGDEIQ